MKALNIIASGYRATLEEQDDTVVWLSHALKGAGADIDVLLRGPAANYVVHGQEVTPLSFGDRTQKCAPDVLGQVAQMIAKGVNVFVMEDDLKARGLSDAPRLDGAQLVANHDAATLIARYDQVWHW